MYDITVNLDQYAVLVTIEGFEDDEIIYGVQSIVAELEDLTTEALTPGEVAAFVHLGRRSLNEAVAAAVHGQHDRD